MRARSRDPSSWLPLAAGSSPRNLAFAYFEISVILLKHWRGPTFVPWVMGSQQWETRLRASIGMVSFWACDSNKWSAAGRISIATLSRDVFMTSYSNFWIRFVKRCILIHCFGKFSGSVFNPTRSKSLSSHSNADAYLIGHCLNGFQGLSLNDRTILFPCIILDRRVSDG